jgi:protein-tyrosine phosphatase
MIDLHTHVLPGIDDGAVDLGAGLALCRKLREQGVDTVVATPHWRSPRFDVVEPGIATAWANLSGLEDAPAFVASLRTLGSSRLVLIELPDDHLPARTWTSLFEAIRNGKRPLIAHPERCKGLRNQREQVAAFVEAGGLLQLTLGSLIGTNGWSMRWHSRGLLKRHPGACVIASDSHNLAARAPRWDRLPVHWRHLVPADLLTVERWGMR